MLITNIIIVILGISLMIAANIYLKRSKNLVIAENISTTALQFNVENFHTQLEMWEYAYDPNDKRLNAFESHNSALNSDAETFISSVENSPDALYKDGLAHTQKIISDLRQVQEDWKYLLSAIDEYRKATELNSSDLQIQQAKNNVDSAAFRNEDLFDRLEFNKEIEYFTVAQSKYLEGLRKETAWFFNFLGITNFAIFFLFIFEVVAYTISVLKDNKKNFFK